MIYNVYNLFFYQPLFNALVWLYNVVGSDLGIATVLLTLLVRLILYPLSQQSIKAQKAMQDLQPKLAEIKAKYPKDKEKQATATMQLYKDEKVNPLSSCLPLLIQLPFFIALFRVFHNVTDPSSLSSLYAFVPNPGTIGHMGFWGLLDLTVANPILALMAGAAQFWQGHMLLQRKPPVHNKDTKDEEFAVIMNQQMTYVMPVVTVFIGWTFPAGLVLYWFLTTLLLAIQQWFTLKNHAPVTPPNPTPAS